MASLTQPISFAGSVQGVQIGDSNTLIQNIFPVPAAFVTFVQDTYEPIRLAIDKWDLVEAERELRPPIREGYRRW